MMLDLRDFAVGAGERNLLLGADKEGGVAQEMHRRYGMPSASGRTLSVTETMEAAFAGIESFIT